MAIDTYRDCLVPLWYTDGSQKISVVRNNEQHQIVLNKITLYEIPDEYQKINTITIDSTTLYEVKYGTIPNSNQFTVNYTIGEITFDSSRDGQTVTIPSYKSRGILYWPASRIYDQLDENGNVISTIGDISANLVHKGAYNYSTTYKPRNIVSYNGSSFMCITKCVNVTPQIGVYWQLIGSKGDKGDKGDPGLGDLVPKGAYDDTHPYIVGDVVQYDGSLYYCIQNSTGHLPTNTSYWDLFLAKGLSSSFTTLDNFYTLGMDASVVPIGVSEFNKSQDRLLVFKNSVIIAEDDSNDGYTIDSTSGYINKITDTWSEGTVFYFLVFKNLYEPISYTDGTLIQAGTINTTQLATGAVTDSILSNGSTSIKQRFTDHINDYAAHDARTTATANKLILRDSAGRAKVTAPSASDDIAIKSTVDVVQTNLTTHIDDLTAHGSDKHYISRQSVINGNFDIWQRGTSLTLSANTLQFLSDRWQDYHNADSGTLPTLIRSRQIINSGEVDKSFYCSRLNINGAGSGFGSNARGFYFQRAEYGTRYLCGNNKKVTVSFWARSSISNKRLGLYLIQSYGTGGSPSSSETINGANWTLTSSWAKYTCTFTTNTLSGKTFGTNNNDYLDIHFAYIWGDNYKSFVNSTSNETYVGSGDIDIAQVQLCAGDQALTFNPISYDQELYKCQRYFELLGFNTNNCFISRSYFADVNSIGFSWSFNTPKRTNPTIGFLGTVNSDYCVTNTSAVEQTGFSFSNDSNFTNTKQALILANKNSHGLTLSDFHIIKIKTTGAIYADSEL